MSDPDNTACAAVSLITQEHFSTHQDHLLSLFLIYTHNIYCMSVCLRKEIPPMLLCQRFIHLTLLIVGFLGNVSLHVVTRVKRLRKGFVHSTHCKVPHDRCIICDIVLEK